MFERERFFFTVGFTGGDFPREVLQKWAPVRFHRVLYCFFVVKMCCFSSVGRTFSIFCDTSRRKVLFMLILASGGLGLIFFRISRDLRPNWAKCVGFPRRGAYFCVFAANCDGIRVLCGFRKGFIWVYTRFTVYFEVMFKGISTEISYFALPQIVAILTVFLERARYVIILHSIA